MRRYRGPALLLLAILGVLLLLTQGGDDVRDPALLDRDQEVDGGRPALLTAEGVTPDHAPAPGLRARPPGLDKDAEVRRGPVTVRVLTPDGTPWAGAYVGYLPAHKRLLPHATMPFDHYVDGVLMTDDHGEVVLQDLPYDGSFAVQAYGSEPRVGEVDLDTLPLAPAAGRVNYELVLGEQVVLRAGVGHRLSVHVVDADRGTPVPRSETHVAGMRVLPRAAPDAPAEHQLMLAYGKESKLELRVTGPNGWIAWERSTWPIRISPYARRLEAWYPLRREVAVALSVLEPDRSAVTSPVITGFDAADRLVVKPACEADAYGRLRVRGVPHLPGEILTVRAKRAKGVVSRTATARLPDDPARALFLEIVLPPEPPRAIGMGGGAGGRFLGRSGRRDLGIGGRGSRRNPPQGSVTVYVRRRGGGPAAGAHVVLRGRTARADINGRAHFKHLGPGTYSVRAHHVGLLPMSGKVTVRGAENARITLTEGKGGALQVHVVDDEGRALSYAALWIKPASGRPWLDLDENDTQRLDPFTDHTGRRVLRGLEPGDVTIKATWGSRAKEVRVGVVEDGSEALRIVLPRPRAP